MNTLTNNSEHEASTVADPELEQLLEDAYRVPPMPRSLAKKLDRMVEAEWGTSPRLAESGWQRVGRMIPVGLRRLRSLPVAATIVAMVLVAVLLNTSGSVYAWSRMLQALEAHGIVSIEDADEVRWLSLSEGMSCSRSEQLVTLIDINERIVLERRPDSHIAVRRPLAESRSTKDHLVLQFLLGRRSNDLTGLSNNGVSGVLDPLTVIDQGWEYTDNRDVQMRIRVRGRDQSSTDVTMQLNAESGMPTMVSVSDGSGPRSQKIVAVPQASGDVLRRTDFPDNVAVIDFRKAQEAGITATIAAADSPSPTNADVAASIVGSKVALSTETINDGTSAVAAPAAVEPERWAVSPGGAALWKAVPETRLTSSETVRQVDAILESVWKKADVEPTDEASPEELLRRVYLDLAGRTPGVSEVRSFLNDTSPDRYEALVNRLLNSHDHASHLATVWRSFLIPDGVDLTAFGGIEAFDRWLAERFESHDSYDQVVRSLLLADGRLSRSGPLLFYSAARLDPDRLAAKTARVFLGMRLECAQCHDHPFEPWKQTDFWGYAAFFARISRPQGTLENVSTVMRVSDVDRGEVMLPETKNVVAPKFLNSKESLEEVEGANRREQLTNWMLAPDNPYFARATANRVWGQMFGRGIVDPIDDFGVQNSPVSQELLDVLAGSFLQSGFNLQELFRTVALSRAYRLSSGAQTIDEDRPAVFAQMNIKTLTAEQVYDCISVATMLGNTEGGPTGLFDLVRYGNSSREAFLQQFRTPAGQPTVYLGGIPQALTLMNGQLIENATGLSSSGLLKSLEAPFFSNEQRLEVLYLATLSRPPRANEWELLRDYVPENATGNELQEALADVLWALLNSAEFTMNH